MSRADLAIEMRQSFLIKICLLQCYQVSLVPCNVLRCNGCSRQKTLHTLFDLIHLVWEEICVWYKNKRSAVLCCVFCGASLLFLPLVLQFRTAVTVWLCSCLDMKPNIFRCALTITGKALICSSLKATITYRSCSQLSFLY